MNTYNHKKPLTNWRYISPKLDGIAITITWDGKQATAHTKTQDVTRKLMYLQFFRDFCDNCKWMPAVSFSGELWLPDYDNTKVQSAINRHDSRLKFRVWGSETLPKGEMLCLLQQTAEQYGLQTIQWQLVTKEISVTQLMATVDKNIEGYVLSNGNMLDYTKIKPVKTADVVVTGINGSTLSLGSADGKYVGDMYCNDCVSVGDIIEVQYNVISKNNKLNNPRFVRIRYDKDIADTLETIKQIH